MGKPLVIVESPTKAKTIEKFLGSKFEVRASYGHVRDLPNSAAEIPATVKKEKWARLGINIDEDFAPLYIVPSEKKKRVDELKKLLKDAPELLLATDEDREGESISWHLLEVLRPKVPVKRLVFHEITKQAIQHAIDTPRKVDENLVQAQETRRVLDRLYGYSVSPLLWKKMKPKLSAGRVQSVALRLLVDRELERMKFVSGTYWSITATFAKGSDSFTADLTHLGGKRVATGKDFEPTSGKVTASDDVVLLTQALAEDASGRFLAATPTVREVEEKPFTQRPSPPFTTSTLQQEGSRKLGFAARRTMQVAQTLYENGFITYMRTDSTSLSQEALSAARNLIAADFGKEFLPNEPRLYQTKVKNAQEAHEAIRPAGTTFTHPEEVRQKMGQEAFRLYDLIWKRTVASQMKDAVGTRITVRIDVADGTFRASGKTIFFPGFLRAYVEGSDDPEADLAEQEKILPPLSKGEALRGEKYAPASHDTQPPARFTEGSLIKELERLGIGRPSTWATIVDLVLSRDYAFRRGTTLVPTFLAIAIVKLLGGHFKNLLDYDFTAKLEDDLDAISRGEYDRHTYLTKFYHGNGHPGLKTLVATGEEQIDPRVVCGIPLFTDPEGRQVEVRIGRYGPFLSNGESRASLPEGLAPDECTPPKVQELLASAARGPESLGNDPSTGLPIYLKTGRFGPYLQLGEQVEGGDKPRMASLLQGMIASTLTLDVAIKLLEFPKNLGEHPELKEPIIAQNGRFGPYIKCGAETRSIPADTSLLDITFEKAIQLLKEPRRRGRSAAPAAPLKEVGVHPQSGKKLVVKSGRYGPYVTDGEINASLQRGADPAALTVEEAVQLLTARAEKIAADGGVTKKKRSKTRS